MMFFAFALGMILSNLLQQHAQGPSIEPPSQVILNYRGQDFRAQELPSDFVEPYCRLVRQGVVQQLSLLAQAALNIHIAELAQREQLSFEAAREKILAVGEISDAMVEQYYSDHAAKFTRPLFEVKEEIRQSIQRTLSKGRSQEIMRGLIDRGDLIFFPDAQPPLCPANDGAKAMPADKLTQN